MRVMRLNKPAPVTEAPLEAADTAVPEPGPGDIRLRVHVCGVCHTDLHTVEGEVETSALPRVPGHQVVGEVVARGPDSNRYQIGDRVGVAWLHWTCGQCRYCRNGLENLCPQARFTGKDVDGGYAEQMVVPQDFAFPLPDAFSDADAAPLLCAGIIGFRALRLSGILPGQRLGLYGFGASAHLAIQVATFWECEVYVFTRSQAHREHARALGAAYAGSARERSPAALDAAVTFAPAGWIVPAALAHLRPGGVLAINAIHMSPIPAMTYELLYGERVVRSVANFTRQDAADFLALAARIPIQTTVETHALADANQVLQALKRSEIQGAAALRP